jgi:hypothetical protein
MLVILIAAGCGHAENPPPTKSPPLPSTASAAPKTNAEPGESIKSTEAGHPVAAGDPSAAASSAAPAAVADAPPSGGALPAKRSEQGEAIEVAFEDIQLPIQADMVFRPFMLTDRVRELDGKRIRINGFMLPDTKTKGIKQFVLLKNIQCKFGPGGQADHLVNVLMVEGASATFRDDAIMVEGVLSVNPFQGPDGNTWSIYDLACERVEKYQPRR